jgi:hypothetical protein
MQALDLKTSRVHQTGDSFVLRGIRGRRRLRAPPDWFWGAGTTA